MNKKLRTFVYPVCAFIVLLLLWQVCVMLSTSEIAFPTPVAVFKEFFYILTHKVGNYYTVVGHVLWSLSRVLVGFSIAAVLGIILGLTMGWFDYVRAVMMPIFNLLRPIAPLAWIPLAILWFRHRGKVQVLPDLHRRLRSVHAQRFRRREPRGQAAGRRGKNAGRFQIAAVL